MTWDDAPPGHEPVLLAEAIAALAPRPGAVLVDGTFGGGGYTRALLEAGAQVVAIDRDPAAVARAQRLGQGAGGRLCVVEGAFSQLDDHAAQCGHAGADGVVLDVGVSSFQLDTPERGFSFRADGPLDMRMGAEGVSAADIVNHAEVGDLAHTLRTYGEERHAGRLARAIVEARPLATTRALADVCERTLPKGRGRGPAIHPATRTFQALRIAVNDELGELARALAAAERLLVEGGRLVVVAFHSLEDRIVKRFLAGRSGRTGGSRHMPLVEGPEASFVPMKGHPLTPGEAECAKNPRARSAKLRGAVRTGAPALALAPDLVPTVRIKGVL